MVAVCREPLFFESYLRPQVWGGRRLETLLNKRLPDSGRYGEAWEISTLPQAASRITQGTWAGTTLQELWRGGLAVQSGRTPESHFPWLVKWLDVDDRLSVQVHPDDAHAHRLLSEPCGKSEAWVVIHAEPTARVYAGLQPGVTPSEIRQSLQHGTLVECLHAFTPRVGDCISLPAGTVHAAGGGLVLAEVQQPSDATFRLFDWNRPGPDGRARTLHIEQALECLCTVQGPVRPVVSARLGSREQLLTTPHFHLTRQVVPVNEGENVASLTVWMMLEGRLKLRWSDGDRVLVRGDTVLLPPGLDVELAPEIGRASLLRIELPGR